MNPAPPLPQTDDFRLEHLSVSARHRRLLRTFKVGNNAKGLEEYLKKWALRDELVGDSRTYLVIDAVSGELACYFSLRTGLIPIKNPDGTLGTVSALELANFAANAAYVESRRPMKHIGAHVFSAFILPLAKSVSALAGARCLCVYALPVRKLVDYYGKLGFSRLPPEQEQFVHGRIKPDYDKGCIFMYQPL